MSPDWEPLDFVSLRETPLGVVSELRSETKNGWLARTRRTMSSEERVLMLRGRVRDKKHSAQELYAFNRGNQGKRGEKVREFERAQRKVKGTIETQNFASLRSFFHLERRATGASLHHFFYFLSLFSILTTSIPLHTPPYFLPAPLSALPRLRPRRVHLPRCLSSRPPDLLRRS